MITITKAHLLHMIVILKLDRRISIVVGIPQYTSVRSSESATVAKPRRQKGQPYDNLNSKSTTAITGDRPTRHLITKSLATRPRINRPPAVIHLTLVTSFETRSRVRQPPSIQINLPVLIYPIYPLRN